jgi:hypothetical protein
MFTKSVGIPLELMFTRAMFAAADGIAQHRLLADVAAVVDQQ